MDAAPHFHDGDHAPLLVASEREQASLAGCALLRSGPARLDFWRGGHRQNCAGASYERALVLLAHAELHEQRGRASDAQESVAAARGLCEPLGARLALLRADAIAARLNPQSIARKPAHPNGLTAREVGVLMRPPMLSGTA